MTTKVFVGNLAFPTTDQALAEAFQECGKVKSGVVITRGRRSLGYGFVEFEQADAAQIAVNTKNNTDLKGRTIKVELASDNPIRPERPSTSNPGPSASAPAGGVSGGVNPKNLGNATSSSEPASGVAPRRQRRINRRRRVNNKPQGERDNRDNNRDNRDNRDRDNNRENRDRDNNRDNRDRDNSEVKNNPARERDNTGGNNKRRRRRTNKSINNEDRVLSTTAVFVANLPFTVKDEDLKAYFKEFSPQSAHVVVTRNGRSRGYGFVDFNNEKDQQNSITAKNKQKFEEREITVTPSYKTQEIAPENK